MAVVTTRQLLEAGMHFGHQTRRWNPKMRRYILGERNGIYIIDLKKTLAGIEDSYTYVRDLVSKGGTVLFVGTKKQTQGPISTYARACGMPFVNERWLGGMLTNFTTISARTSKLREFEAMERSGDFDAMPKKEGLKHRRELEKLRRNLGGIRDLDRLPDAIFVIDTKKEHIAVTEATKLHLPIVAVVDTNCDPDVVTHVIPGNDDAIRSGALMCRVIAEAVREGQWVAANRPAPARPAPAPVQARTSAPRQPAKNIAEATPAELAADAAAAAESAGDQPAPVAEAPATPSAPPVAESKATAPAEAVATEAVAIEAVATEAAQPESEEASATEAVATEAAQPESEEASAIGTSEVDAFTQEV